MLHAWIVRVFVFDRSRDGKETKQTTKGTCTVPGCVCIGVLLLVRVVCGIRVLSSRSNGDRTSSKIHHRRTHTLQQHDQHRQSIP